MTRANEVLKKIDEARKAAHPDDKFVVYDTTTNKLAHSAGKFWRSTKAATDALPNLDGFSDGNLKVASQVWFMDNLYNKPV